MSLLRVSSVALPIEFGDEASNFAAAQAALQRSEPGPHLIVLPELATSGYVFHDIDEARGLSMTVDDPRLTGLADAVPEGAVAVIGFCERVGEQLFNSALVFDRTGTLGCYRKAHLWDEEYRFFSLGDEAGMVLDTPIGRLGVAICYDIEFPEVPRRLALAGAEVLALPVNWPLAERPTGEHAPETIQAMAAARASRLPIAIADRHGTERGVQWTGGTAVVDRDGWIVATPDADGIASAVVSVDPSKTLGANNDVFADRRPELY
ncbi:carbon-nitrogen hydrolase [Mycobacterium frederiksbergense]|uniref:nitrilase-related carbon-nitrogen hydrolase n=1 Tax=Mycolicibacterium frederiksbergense TaxID=117567 RepID=UPI0021F39C0E|nr:nitrilase-related carbon-nitrogen hydrolase [Mycolicibacterium frederiksbergense]MCV7045253.1 carbon-nitrogen hydrolase [Mycolicibacterium frederiksbergense]